MKENILYEDSLAIVDSNAIHLKKYYIPGFTKKINLSSIDFIEQPEPSLITGKWILWGTGDFKTWFPADFSRNKRDVIFRIHRKNKKLLMGFTVEDTEKFKECIKELVPLK